MGRQAAPDAPARAGAAAGFRSGTSIPAVGARVRTAGPAVGAEVVPGRTSPAGSGICSSTPPADGSEPPAGLLPAAFVSVLAETAGWDAVSSIIGKISRACMEDPAAAAPARGGVAAMGCLPIEPRRALERVARDGARPPEGAEPLALKHQLMSSKCPRACNRRRTCDSQRRQWGRGRATSQPCSSAHGTARRLSGLAHLSFELARLSARGNAPRGGRGRGGDATALPATTYMAGRVGRALGGMLHCEKRRMVQRERSGGVGRGHRQNAQEGAKKGQGSDGDDGQSCEGADFSGNGGVVYRPAHGHGCPVRLSRLPPLERALYRDTVWPTTSASASWPQAHVSRNESHEGNGKHQGSWATRPHWPHVKIAYKLSVGAHLRRWWRWWRCWGRRTCKQAAHSPKEMRMPPATSRTDDAWPHWPSAAAVALRVNSPRP